MDPVLIYTDDQEIRAEAAKVEKYLKYYNKVYLGITTLGVTLTLDQTINLVQRQRQSARTIGWDILDDYVLERLADKAYGHEINGVKLDRAKLKSLIQLPDTAQLKSDLTEMLQTVIHGALPIDNKLIQLDGGRIEKVSDFDERLALKHTHYTRTDKGAKLANDLQVICDALNHFDEDYNNHLLGSLAHSHINSSGRLETSIPGIDCIDDTFVLSVRFIRIFERHGSFKEPQ